uniref:Primase C-terminal 1 domain-containing protein n=1 Tax=uncultured prokaryote TaxID=198431 RepID=A0A0H5Q1H0_9ZZZZ|nr:hypothetical protein [uncultured prokaryote]
MTILAGLETLASSKGAEFRSHFIGTQRVFMCSKTKTDQLAKAYSESLHLFEFFQPHPSLCRFIVIDIDNYFALDYIYDLPTDIRPHAVVMTTKGVQAFWLIEPVPLSGSARPGPIQFAQDVGQLLQLACNGDSAVHPLTPVKCRNPLYEGADRLYVATREPYKLKELAEPLRAYIKARGLSLSSQPSKPAKASPVVTGSLAEGGRNQGIFDAIRQVAYQGGDYESLAYELASKCDPPLPEAEVAGIVRSVAKFMATKYKPREYKRKEGEPVPEALREFMAEIGRKGGSVNSEAQQRQQKAFISAGTTVRSAQAIGRRAQIQALKEAGYKQREVAEKMGLGIATIKRAWN